MIDESGKLKALEEYTNSASRCYPTLADGETIPGVAGAWTLGAFKEIIPVDTVTSDFSIYAIIVEGASADDIYEIVLYAETTEIARVRAAIVGLGAAKILPVLPVQTPRILKNTQIQAKCANSAGGSESITISLQKRVYP